MLHGIELENFKAFGKRACIPFAPITLIFGENSAGKSTILQALKLLKQTRESREIGATLLPRAENGIVNLGSFWEMIFNHDLERTLSIRVETKVDRTELFPLAFRRDKIGIELSFKMSSEEKVVFLNQIKVYYGEPSNFIAEFQRSDETIEPHEFLMGFFSDSNKFSVSKLSAMKCTRLTKDPDYWEHEFKWCEAHKEQLLQQLEERLEDLKHPNEQFGRNGDRRKKLFVSLKSGIELLRSPNLETYVSKRYNEEMNTILGLQGFLPIRIMSDRRNSWISELRLSRELHTYRSMRFDVALLAEAAGLGLEQALKMLFSMGPFRKTPERWYIFQGTSPQDVGYQGDLLPDLLFRRPELVDEANEWLKKLDLGYKLKVEPVDTDSGDLFEVRLIDIRQKESVNVALPDVGFGISQLLPFVVQSLVPGKQIISIEQPEIHIHPRLQADLGDLLAESIKKHQKQFIVETHSEHLILRLQRLVYKGELKPKDVSVIYVSRGPEGAKVERLNLDEEGDFIDEWPNGFFLERLRELR